MTNKELACQVDALGGLRDRIHVMVEKEKAQTVVVKTCLAKRKAGKRKAKGDRYEADLSTGNKGLVIEDLAKFRTAAGPKFLACVKVDLTKARNALGADKVKDLGRMKPKPDVLRVYKLAPGKAPRRAICKKGRGNKK